MLNTILTIVVVLVVLWLVGFLCFARRRLIDTYTSCNSGNFDCCLASNWQKAVEIKRYFKEI